MMRSLYSGVSGLKNHQTRMDVIGNNIANVNTAGFKGSRVTFQDMLSQTITGASSPQGNKGGTNPQQIGLGMTVASIDTVFTDGSVQSTGKNTDLCISGNGFFVMSDGAKEYYTRNGAFEFDSQGNYVLPGSGLNVKGWIADANGNVSTSGPLTNIVVPSGQTMAAVATTKAEASGNLSAEAPVGYIYTMKATAAKAMAVGDSVYDAKGNVMGTVTVAGAAGGEFTFKTKDVATTPPTQIFDSATHALGALTTTKTNSIYEVKMTVAGLKPQVGDSVYDATGTNVIGKVTVAAVTSGGEFTFETDSIENAPTVGAVGATKITSNSIKNSIYTVTATIPAGGTTPGVGDDVYDATGVNVIGKVATVDTGAGTFTFKTTTDATNPPSGAIRTTAGTAGNTGTITGSSVATSHYNVKATVAGATPQVGDIVYDSTGTNPIGKVTIAATSPGGSFTFETTASMVAAPTAVKMGGNATITGNDIKSSSYTMTGTALHDMKVGDSIYDSTGTTVIGTVTVAAEAGKEFTFVTNSITGTPPVAPVSVNDGKGTPANEITVDPANIVSKAGGEKNTKLISFAAYDSQGIKHTISGNLVKSATNEWIFTPTSPADSGATVSTNDIVIKFDANGNFLSGSGAVTITPVDPPLGSSVLTVSLDFSGMKQYAGETNVSVEKDGNAAGVLDSVSTDSSGMIVGSFSNGMKKNLAQVALATFNNPAGLTKEGSSLFSKSNNSGEVKISTAGSGGAGTLTPSAIEMSNVNLSDQFSDMIVTQRGFQSNSKIITVSDEMIETLVNMKR